MQCHCLGWWRAAQLISAGILADKYALHMGRIL